MALDTLKPATRRNVLAAAAGALAAFAAQAIGRPLAARAADGDPVLVGGEYTSSSVTKIASSTTTALDVALMGEATNAVGVLGLTDTSRGVQGTGGTSGMGVVGNAKANIGVFGSNGGAGLNADKPAIAGYAGDGNTGVLGYSGTGDIPTTPAKTGVFGLAAQDSSATGVAGKSINGTGVRGDSESGAGVHGVTFTGSAVKADAAANNGIAVDAIGIGPTPVIRAISIGGGRAVDAATNSSGPAAIVGRSYGSTGVIGFSAQGSSPPATGPSWTGVYGIATEGAAAARAVRGDSLSGRGVHGQATTGRGLHGQATSGQGVYGIATTGIAGQFVSSSGTALQVNGKARFDRSGKIPVAAGASSVTKTLAGVTTGSIVLALFQSNEPGVWVRAVVPAAGSFRIYFNVSLPTTATVAYFVLN